jgi:hypothetical protein
MAEKKRMARGRGGWRPNAGRKPAIHQRDIDPATAEALLKHYDLKRVLDRLLRHKSPDVQLRTVAVLMKMLPKSKGDSSDSAPNPRFSTKRGNPFQEQAEREAQIAKLEHSLGLMPSLPPASLIAATPMPKSNNRSKQTQP